MMRTQRLASWSQQPRLFSPFSSSSMTHVATAKTAAAAVGSALAEARLSGRSASLGTNTPSLSLAEAYEAQDANHAHLVAAGWTLAGYKVGATAPAAQTRLGLQAPFWGRLYRQRTNATPSPYAAVRCSLSGDALRGVEAEFALVLKRDIVPLADGQEYSVTRLLEDHVALVAPAVELCASRLAAVAAASNPAINGSMIVADSGGNGGAVLGLEMAVAPSSFDLRTQTASIAIDGKVVATGSGRDVMGDPVASLKWLVDTVVSGGPRLTLYASQVIMTGAVCGLVPVIRPSYVRISFPGWRAGQERTLEWMLDLSVRS